MHSSRVAILYSTEDTVIVTGLARRLMFYKQQYAGLGRRSRLCAANQAAHSAFASLFKRFVLMDRSQGRGAV